MVAVLRLIVVFKTSDEESSAAEEEEEEKEAETKTNAVLISNTFSPRGHAFTRLGHFK